MRSWLKILVSFAMLAGAAWSAPSVEESFVNRFTKDPFATSAPDPTSALLIATGLVCFGLTRKDRGNR